MRLELQSKVEAKTVVSTVKKADGSIVISNNSRKTATCTANAR